MRIISITILIFIIAISKTLFSAEKDSVINSVFVLIYNENYKEAHNAISANHLVLGDFYSDVLKIDLLWWEFIRLDKNKHKKEEFNLFLEKFDSEYASKPELKLRQLIKNSYQIRYELKSRHFISAINTRTTLKRLLNEILSEEMILPKNRIKLLELYKTLFNYFDNLINPFFSQNKRKIRTKALIQIGRFSNDNDLIIKTLSLYFLGQIYLNIENDKDLGISCFTELFEYYTNNMFFKAILEQNKEKSYP